MRQSTKDNRTATVTTAANEKERLARLYGYKVVGEFEASGTFQHVASFAARVFDAPMCFVDFVDLDSVIINSSVGAKGISRVDRGISLCSMAILKDGVTVFRNTTEEPCLADNPLVYGELCLQFYAAAPIRTADGFNLGVVAIGDRKPRNFSKAEEQILEGLAANVMEELEERRMNRAFIS